MILILRPCPSTIRGQGWPSYRRDASAGSARRFRRNAFGRAVRDAARTGQRLGALYNVVAFVAATGPIPLERRLGAWRVQATSVAASGLAMLALPSTRDVTTLMVLMLGIGLGGLGRAGTMGNTYITLVDHAPWRATVSTWKYSTFLSSPDADRGSDDAADLWSATGRRPAQRHHPVRHRDAAGRSGNARCRMEAGVNNIGWMAPGQSASGSDNR
jgi:hypothetical protein